MELGARPSDTCSVRHPRTLRGECTQDIEGSTERMALITITGVSIRYRGPYLLDDVSCQIEAGQRIGLLGRNGMGKTTLLRMLAGEVTPDSGSISPEEGARIAMLPQEVPADLVGSIAEVVASGMEVNGAGEQADSWRDEQRVERILMRMGLSGDAAVGTLSSGMKRRVLLARALVSEPDVLLLDEPTNHLDLEAIRWLETFLLGWRGTLIFVTHDRMFLRKLANRIIEIDRGAIFDWMCDYDTFLQRKEDALAAEEKQNELFDKKLAAEEAWIRQGIKARRTRNQGRVRALQRLRSERQERRSRQGNVRMTIQSGQRSGNLVAEVEQVSFKYGERPIVEDFSTMVMRGDKVGLIGPNGAGKTTMLRILLGELTPQQGKVRLGTNLQIAYFDQLRGQLDEEQTIQENVGDGYDTVTVNGVSKHIIGYLQEFLFSPDRARTQIKFLSGGERNRVMLAKLFAKPANVLVLDEPTNDLDMETLELLESLLVDFSGTILLVSHDREFLNNVVTSSIVFEPTGVKEYDGGYDDWQRIAASQAPAAVAETTQRKAKSTSPEKTSRQRKRSFKEQKELDSLPDRIEQLEVQIASMHTAMAEPDFYQRPGEEISAEQARLADLEAELAAAYARWEELEEIGQ